MTEAHVSESAVHRLSVIVPAFNEAGAVPATLAAIDRARSRAHAACGCESELLVVDNASTDATLRIPSGFRHSWR